jgi:hypothetical protein
MSPIECIYGFCIILRIYNDYFPEQQLLIYRSIFVMENCCLFSELSTEFLNVI